MAKERLKLVGVRIQNFRCFGDTGLVPIDPDITTLIAENENGKTAFLEAVAWCLSDTAFDPDDLRDGTLAGEPVPIATLKFAVPQAVREELKAAGLPALREVAIIRRSDGTRIVADSGTEQTVEPSDVVEEFDRVRDALVQRLRKPAMAEPHATHRDEALELLEEAEWGGDAVHASVSGLLRDNVYPVLDGATQSEVDDLLRQFSEAENAERPPSAYELLRPYLPVIVYFDDRVDHLRDLVRYDEVASAEGSEFRTMENLAQLAGVDLRKVASSDPHKRQELSDRGSRTVTEDARGFWEGGDLEMRITFEPEQMVVTVEHAGRRQRPTRRSGGMQWYLGFFVNFRAETRERLEGAVLLLDEPGLRLHLRQQAKLLAFFEEIAKTNQIVYSTHLPSMIAASKLGRIRLFDADPDNRGAVRVQSKVQAIRGSGDAMRPVRANLGMGIAQAIAIGDKTLVVEGPVDVMVVDAMSKFCARMRATSLIDGTTLFATVGAGKKMIPFVTLVANESTAGAVLVDDDREGDRAAREISKVFGELVPVVRTHVDGDKPSGREIEDLFERDYYLELVNAAHADRIAGYTPIEAVDLDASHPITEAVSAVFAKRKYGKFAKIHPAEELQRRLLRYEGGPDRSTIERFEALFKRINEALGVIG
jgi:hypothetical protein